MDQAIRNKQQGKPRILVAPLDWGLGHTTRCVPVIRALLENGAEVFLAGNERQSALLALEFPSLPFLPLEGYNVRYAATPAGVYGALLRQVPRILRVIQQEQEWLRKAIAGYGFDAVISDNRYGLYHPRIPCIFITHQLNIMSGLGAWTARMLRKKNYACINRFTACWVPDYHENGGLAGQLSHPTQLPRIPVHYMGPLSRLAPVPMPVPGHHIVVMLSGPEPQRSLLEKIVLRDLPAFEGTVTLIRGLPGDRDIPTSLPHIRVHNHLTGDELAAELARASLVIARCGYSTVMDLAALGKKSILIPTPGQGEQEYLARYLGEKQFTLAVKQKDFDLQKAIAAASQFPYRLPATGDHATSLRKLVTELVTSLGVAPPGAMPARQ